MTEGRKDIAKSVLAVFAGLVAVIILSEGTDQVLIALGVYPGRDQQMNSAALLSFALTYRCVFDGFGSYLTARLAPQNPMRHGMITGTIGFVLALAGATAAVISGGKMGPVWYPIALAISALPTAWIGSTIYVRSRAASQ